MGPQDQLDQTARQDHWEPQPHHHHHGHHHHAQLSASPHVSQHAQLTAVHRRNISELMISSPVWNGSFVCCRSSSTGFILEASHLNTPTSFEKLFLYIFVYNASYIEINVVIVKK